ncbi:adenosylcobinamide-GDP ribazoletransferase [Actibacterium lipolyticum]|nr:adenosylcobinamide-GDP ribazoletransferase [Actibacterium lipolyticum]
MARLAELQLAIIFLTRLPAGRMRDGSLSIGASAWAWPVAGVFVGGISALIYAAAWGLGLPAGPSAVLALGAGILVCGGLHEDGFADLADGCGGGRDRAQKLEIMRDSRIGAYGVLAVIFSFGLRASAITSLSDPLLVIPCLIGVAAASRAPMAVWLYLLPAAREDGLGHSSKQINGMAVIVAITFGCIFLLPLGGIAVLSVAIAVAIGSGAVAAFAVRQIGGQTGDVLGAVQQVSEVAAWIACLAVLV